MAQDKASLSTLDSFKPYVPSEKTIPEFTPRAVILGMIFGVVFGAVTVYVGLRAGLTVAASIPIAVLSISLLRALGKATILENNIVQTTGSAGESVAGGVIFTLPALLKRAATWLPTCRRNGSNAAPRSYRDRRKMQCRLSRRLERSEE